MYFGHAHVRSPNGTAEGWNYLCVALNTTTGTMESRADGFVWLNALAKLPGAFLLGKPDFHYIGFRPIGCDEWVKSTNAMLEVGVLVVVEPFSLLITVMLKEGQSWDLCSSAVHRYQ